MRLSILFLFFASFVFSQNYDTKIAYQFYEEGEYEKAVEIYKNITTSSSNLSAYYHPYLQSLLNLEDCLKQ